MLDVLFWIKLFAAAVAAGALAWIVFYFAGSVSLEAGPSKHLQDFHGEQSSSEGQAAIGDRVVKSMPLSVNEWEMHLAWAQRGGYYPGQRFGNIIFAGLLYAAGGLIVVLMRPAPVFFLFPLMAFAFPFIAMRSKANKVRKKAIRSLPELASLVAAEISAGTPSDQAVMRAGQLPGPLGGLLSEAVAFSHQSGRPLFSRKPVRGALVDVFSRTGMPAIRAFAMQLDEVAGKGIDAPELMNQTARSLAREYREYVMREKELLGGKLVRHVAFHFFFPAILIILAAFFIPMIELMTQ